MFISITQELGKFLTFMYLLEIGQLKLDMAKQLEMTSTRVMISMASVFVNMSSDLRSAFFLFRNFCSKLSEHQSILRLQVSIMNRLQLYTSFETDPVTKQYNNKSDSEPISRYSMRKV